MKRYLRRAARISAALLCAIAFFMPPFTAPAHAEAALASGVVNTGALNVRTGPTVRDTIVTTIKKGTAVKIYEVRGTWLRVDVPAESKTGYVSGKYITVDRASLAAYGLGVTSGGVNLRAKATSKSDKIVTLSVGTGVTLVSVASNGWYQVRVHGTGQEGYVSNSYIKVVSKTAKTSTASAGSAYINASSVNLRTGASTKYQSIGRLAKNTAVTVEGSSGQWTKVKVTSTGKTGYVFSTYVTVNALSAATPTPAAQNPGAFITGSGVNLRTGPSTSKSRIASLAKHTAVTVLGSSGKWYKVKVTATGKTGYVYSAYVSLGAASATPTPTATPVQSASAGASAYITADGVNFRTGPSTKYASLGKLGKNTTVRVLNTSGSWYQLQIVSTGKTGYVYRSYVFLLPSTPTPTAKPATPAPTTAPTATPTTAPTATPTAPTQTAAPTATPVATPTVSPTA